MLLVILVVKITDRLLNVVLNTLYSLVY